MQLNSSAFPQKSKPIIKSKVHKLIEDSDRSQEIKIRIFQKQDTDQLISLQNEWFPLKYSSQFYQKIIWGQTYCLIAEVTLVMKDQSKVKVIVGAIVFETCNSNSYVEGQYFLISWMNFKWNSIYIMTLGVIDEFRRNGIGCKLVQQVLKLTKDNFNVKLVYLHVVQYNKAAIGFYLKMKFKELECIEQYYNIEGKKYAGLVLGVYCNGGVRREGWIEWLDRIIWRKKTQLIP